MGVINRWGEDVNRTAGGVGVVTNLCRSIKWAWLAGCGGWENVIC